MDVDVRQDAGMQDVAVSEKHYIVDQVVCIGCNNLPPQGSLAENDAIEEDEDQDTTSDIASESGCETNSDIETEIVTDFSHFMIHVDDDN